MSKKSMLSVFSMLVVMGMLVSLALPANAQPTGRDVGPGDLQAVDPSDVVAHAIAPEGLDQAVKGASGPTHYILVLKDAPLATYDGSIQGYEATSPSYTGELKLDSAAVESVSYLGYLGAQQDKVVTAIEEVVSHEVNVLAKFKVTINAIGVELTPEELQNIAEKVPGIVYVEREKIQQYTTDIGPGFIGAPGVWNDVVDGTLGEGVLVGIIDGGINSDHPSFAEVGPVDGYVHVNPLGMGNYLGVCDSTNPDYDPTFVCNSKLIGAYSYVETDPVYELYSPEDSGGHGSHTASTVAGNVVDAAMEKPTLTETQRISGVAPHANIIAYDVCYEDSGNGGCPGLAILNGIEQATIDEVDVINFSISGGENPYSDSGEIAFLGATEAGVFVSTSAGNNGPDPETTGHRSPWLMSTAASTHNRTYLNGVIDMAGGDTTPPADIVGKGFTSSLALSPIVYAGDFGNPLCYLASEGGVWTAGTDFTGEIVVCDRGDNARVDKALAVSLQGAAGFVLANNAASAGALVGDAYVIPGTHITYADGVVLKAWLASGSGHMAAIQGATRDLSPSNGNVMADFSSRGPNGTIDVLKPDVTAPGVDIWAAVNSPIPGVGNPEFDFYSGTSMSSPHTAGAAALLTAVHPDWSPSEIKSALMLTAVNPGIRKEDGTTMGDIFDFGAGLIQVDLAAKSGLIMEEIIANYEAADPALGGDPQTLNLASVYSSLCLSSCSWEREVTNPLGVATSWTVATVEPVGVDITVTPATFTLASGASQILTITADVTTATLGEWYFGDVQFTEDSSLAPDAHIPLAVVPSAGILPEKVVVDTRRDAGSKLIEGLQSVAITALNIQSYGLAQPIIDSFSLLQDPTNGDPFDNLDDVQITTYDVPANAMRFVAEVTETTSLDVDIYLYVDDGVDFYELANSATGTAFEYIDVMNPPEGTYYLFTQNWDDSVNGEADDITVSAGVVVADEGNMSFTGPATVPQGDLFDIRLFWDEPALMSGEHWYGAFTIGTDAGNPGNVGTVKVDLRRWDDDVVKSSDVSMAYTDDIVTYTITVAPNITGEDLTYMIEDTIPAGMEYVPASVTGGATVVGNTVSWTGVMHGSPIYNITTDATDPMCDTGFGGYVNLKDFGINPQSSITGDTTVWTAFSAQNPFVFFGQSYTGLGFTDDGFLVFDYANNYGGSPWNSQSLPDPDMPNNVAAVLWQDMEIVYNATTTRGVSLATAGTSTSIVEYDDIQAYGDPTQTYDFEAVVYSGVDNAPGAYEMVFAYDNLNGGISPVTIGVENALGDEAYAYVNNADASDWIENGTMICFDYVAPTTPHVITYQAKVVTTDSMQITNVAEHSVDNPGSATAEAVNVIWVNTFQFWFPVIRR